MREYEQFRFLYFFISSFYSQVFFSEVVLMLLVEDLEDNKEEIGKNKVKCF
jgi:hypothetical protein